MAVQPPPYPPQYAPTPAPYPPQPPAYPYYPLPPALRHTNPVLARLPVLGSLLILICFFLPWINFPYYLLFGFSPQPPSEYQLRTFFQQSGFPSSDIENLTQLAKIAVSGNINGPDLHQANGIIRLYLNPTSPSYNYYFPNQETGQIVNLISIGITATLIIPLAGLIGLLMLTGARWSRILAQWVALLGLGLLLIAIAALLALQTPDLPVKLISIFSTGVWGSLAGLIWQFLTPFFVRSR